MKKVLYGTSALIAAGLLATSAQAADPIKLSVGGFSTWMVGFTSQDDDFQDAVFKDYNNLHIVGNNEVIFSGKTTLDNGLTIGVKMELEAGGGSESTGGDSIDESFMTIAGSFGTLIVGTEDAGTALLRTGAKEVNMGLDESDSMTRWVAAPTAVKYAVATYANANDSEKLTYVTPNWNGFQAGASIDPGYGSEDNRALRDNSASGNGELYGAAAMYTGTFDNVGVTVAGGYATLDSNTTHDDDIWQVSGQVRVSGFTIGAAYLNRDQTLNNRTDGEMDGYTWEAGITYETGPYAVSLVYFNSTMEGDNTDNDEDEMDYFALSGKYDLGGGIALTGTALHQEYTDESDDTLAYAANHNKGIAGFVGIKASF